MVSRRLIWSWDGYPYFFVKFTLSLSLYCLRQFLLNKRQPSSLDFLCYLSYNCLFCLLRLTLTFGIRACEERETWEENCKVSEKRKKSKSTQVKTTMSWVKHERRVQESLWNCSNNHKWHLMTLYSLPHFNDHSDHWRMLMENFKDPKSIGIL